MKNIKNMKKILLILALLLPQLRLAADGYSHLTFLTTEGPRQIGVNNLQIALAGDMLNASNGVETLSLSLASLQKMYFSGEDTTAWSGVDEVVFSDAEPVMVYTPAGVLIGEYKTLLNAVTTLHGGVYVFRQGRAGKSIMIQ